MQTGRRLRQPSVVPRKASEAGYPGKAAFDHPTAWQEHKAILSGGQFDYFQTDTLCSGVRRGLFASVALVNKGHLSRFAGGFLHLRNQGADLGSILLICRRHQNSQ